jgi:5-methylcytosine-specific restriction endonuclease McrA
MSEQTFDSNERLAIWEAHGKICQYGREPISLDSYGVDHIIPEKIQPDELVKLKGVYKLPADFDVLNYYNHVPSCDQCNNRKGSNAEGYSQFFIATALEAAKKRRQRSPSRFES